MSTDALIWVSFAVFAGVFSGANMLLNQYYKIPGLLIVLGSRLLSVLVMLPFALLITWPSAPVYYLAVAATGVFAGFGDIRMYNVTAKLGGGVVSRLIPLLVPVTFFSWFFFAPEQVQDHLAAPLQSLLIITALGACVYFASRLQTSCAVSREALKLMAPTILCYGLNGAFAKLALQNADLHAGVYGYMMIQTIIALGFTGGYYLWQKQRKHPAEIITFRKHIEKRVWLACGLASFFWLSHMIFKIYAFGFINNPAYVNAVVLLAPLWVILFYKAVGHKENADIKAGIGILASIIALVLLTAR
ncbi:MAG: hypothetical protein EP349_02855 [Alphaproteobacteria bacterium]|nr:MAG: hypothetical protein EP349_02855 [Alphaproteobacteria bacterium]